MKKSKWNGYLNNKLNTPRELELSGLNKVFTIRIVNALIPITEIEISRRILLFLLQKDFVNMMIFVGLFVFARIVVGVMTSLSEFVGSRVRGEIQISLFKNLLDKNSSLCPINSDEFSSSDKVAIANGDCDKYIDRIMGRVDLYVSFFSVPLYVIYGFTLNMVITISILIISIILSFLNKKNKQKSYESNEEINERYEKWSCFLWKALDNLEVIKVFLSKSKIVKEHRKRNDRLTESFNKSLKVYLDVCLIEESSDMAFTLLILMFSFVGIMNGKMEIASIFAVVESMGMIQKIIFKIPEQLIVYHELDSIASRINTFFALSEDCGHELLAENMETVEIKSVSYSLQDKLLLDNIDFSFQKGKFYILVGQSGCGKSTLIKLLAKCVLPEQGYVTWNGKNLKDIKRESLYDKMAYITQTQYFLSDTIKNNVYFGEDNKELYGKVINETGIAQALEKNESNDEQIISVEGDPLSSGEQQMLSFARLLCNLKDVILLDEAFSALDPAKEKMYFEMLKKITFSGKTVILVSHRLSNIELADSIIFMKDGKICESGTWEHMKKSGTLFGEWYEKQQGRDN